MKIDGKALADQLFQTLQNDIIRLKQKGLTPTLAVILIGDNPASASYVRQKQKAAEKIGADLRIINYDVGIKKETLLRYIKQLNQDAGIHGIIIQRPLPMCLQVPNILNSINPEKDVDGFVSASKFSVPVARAVEKILKKIYELRFMMYEEKQFILWLKKQNIVILGRGETAGEPIARQFQMSNVKCQIIHSQTKNACKILKSSDIIISCVGKERIIQAPCLTNGVILISVGIWRDSTGKLHGDYEEDEIKNIASFYTPTPGGVGPVNVACLMANLVSSALPQS